MDKSEYQRYLASREWALLKVEVRKRSGGKCERCMVGKYDATHHLTYERIGHEELSDLLAVCEQCHKFLSGQSEYDPSMVTAKLAAQAIEETTSNKPDVHVLYNLLVDLDEDKLATELFGLMVEIQTQLEERFLPALCEHFQEWREAHEQCLYYDSLKQEKP